MAKQSGLGDQFFVSGYDLSGDTAALTAIRSSRALLDVTAINKSAMERIFGLRDGELAFNVWFNDLGAVNRAGATDSSFLVLSALPDADVLAAYLRGATVGSPAAALQAKQVNYDWARGADGSFAGSVQCLGQGERLEWGVMGTPGKRTDSTATNGGSWDNLPTSTFTSNGLAAYLHVVDVTGTSVTVALQESSDNGGGDAGAAVTGGAFAAVTPAAAPTAQRIETSLSQTVERYLRVVTTGTFSNAQFAVVVVRYANAAKDLAA